MMKKLIQWSALAALLTMFVAPTVAMAQHGEHTAAEEMVEEIHADEDPHDAHGDAHHVAITSASTFANWHFFFVCLTFLSVVLVVGFGYKKVGKPALENRRREIEESLAEAQATKAEAEALREEYRSRLAKMEDELERIRTEMIKAGEADRDRIVQEAEAKAASMRKDTEFQISQKMKQLQGDLKKEAALAAIAAAEEVIKAQASASDQSRLAEDYLKQIASAAKAEELRS